jgi:hypothetical protein
VKEEYKCKNTITRQEKNTNITSTKKKSTIIMQRKNLNIVARQRKT